jgi:hypothetical protein
MTNLTSTFSLYEVFRILLPGTYVCLAAFDFLNKWGVGNEVFQDSTINTALNIIIIIMVGLFFYSFDFPRMLRRFQKSLPTVQIKIKHSDIADDKISNSYFDFYDELDINFKHKHEKYSGYFHLSLNMTLTSILIFLVSVLSNCCNHFSYFLFISLLILVLSIIVSFNIYHYRLKHSYQRHLEKYYLSKQYKNLIQK